MLTRSSKWSSLKAWAMKLTMRRGAKRAKVALARKLAVILHRSGARRPTSASRPLPETQRSRTKLYRQHNDLLTVLARDVSRRDEDDEKPMDTWECYAIPLSRLALVASRRPHHVTIIASNTNRSMPPRNKPLDLKAQ